jgi:hypothetical protein
MYNSNETRSIAAERERQMQQRNKVIFERNKVVIENADRQHREYKQQIKNFENSDLEQRAFLQGARKKSTAANID